MHLRYSSREDHYSPILVKNVNVWGVSKYHGFFEGPIKVTYCRKIKLNFGMRLLLINMDLQEGMVIKGI